MELLLQRASRATRPSPRCRALLHTQTYAILFAFCHGPLTLLTIPAPTLDHRLKDNQLGPKGGAALAEGLKGNSTLQSLK